MDCRKQTAQKLLLFSVQADAGRSRVTQAHSWRVEVKIMKRRCCSAGCGRFALKVVDWVSFEGRALSLQQ